MGLKRGQHQQQFMMMIATILLGGDNADDDDNPDGIPVPVQVETGEGSSDAVKDADEKADDHAPKKRIHSSTNAAKIVHV
ncbi:unnamed protein product [Brassica rapa]|uniref:Uncharacterized protein n=2 Tax=Brassica TaxID=3705 RepID=A0A8D9CT41_BRACM|nr:unnamed protein product [Brassica napus]CAG7862759.1 unnamed protein product [Brassica rapa]